MKEEKETTVEQSRRKFLKTATKLAIYTPPAMLAISKPSFATFAKSGGAIIEGTRSKKKRTKTRRRK